VCRKSGFALALSKNIRMHIMYFLKPMEAQKKEEIVQLAQIIYQYVASSVDFMHQVT
jgi:hypothetical protein